MRNPLLNVDEMKTHLSEGDLIIEPGSLIVEKTITNPNGANFAALLRYVVRTPGNGLFHEGIYIPDFGEKIGHTLLLPRGLERKTFFHPLETSAVQEGLSKIPGLSGHPHSVKQIIYKGKNRAVVSMP